MNKKELENKYNIVIGHAREWSGSQGDCQRYGLNPLTAWAYSRYNDNMGGWYEPTKAFRTLTELALGLEGR